MSDSTRIPAAPDMSFVTSSIAAELRPVALDRAKVAALGRLLADRVRRSVETHSDLTTVRREDRAWSAVGPGLTQCVLQESGGMRTYLLQVDANSPVPWSPEAKAAEVLVIEGSLRVASGATSTSLFQLQQLVVDKTNPVDLRAGNAGARLYVRSRLVEVDALPAAEAQWWVAAQNSSAASSRPSGEWSPFLEGTDAIDLQTHGGVASMLLRIGPGVKLPDHRHALDEDCLMLEGDMFLGDVLVRAGDYQLARAGGKHVGIMSDAGGLFYFHGAVADSASEEAV